MSDEKNVEITEGKKELLIRLTKEEGEFFILMSACTRAPYVECDPETFDDEVMIYFDEQSAKAKTEELAQKKIPTTVLKLASKQMLLFFTTLYTMGVNALHLSFNGEETTMQIQEIVKKRDQKEAPDGSVWVENPQLHLTAVYFAQELRRPAEEDTKEHLKELQEEMLADFRKSSLIFAIQKDTNATPMIKLKDGEKYQPVFTDVLEFRKFCQDDSFRPVIVKAEQLPKVLDKDAEGVILNMLGVNLPLQITRPIPVMNAVPANDPAVLAKAAADAAATAIREANAEKSEKKDDEEEK